MIIIINPPSGVVILDGATASGISMVGVDPTIQSIQFNTYNEFGIVSFLAGGGGIIPPSQDITSITPWQAQVDEATAIIYARENPVTYYSIVDPVGGSIVVTTVGWPQPPDTTNIVPPEAATGQSIYWTGSAFVLASFDITLPLADAKISLINTTRADAAAAVDVEVGLYSGVQLITVPDVNALETKTYQPTTLGTYQTYVDDQTAAAVAQINAAATVPDLYPINPASVPFSPPQLPNGTLNTGRGGPGQAGPLDLNLSYFSALDVAGATESDLELYVPGTDTVIPYDAGLPAPFTFDSMGNCFVDGDWRLVIRYAGGGAVLSTITVPEGANVDVPWTYNPVIPPMGSSRSSSK